MIETTEEYLEAIRQVYSLSNFHDIREVRQVDTIAEIRGCVALSDLNKSESAKAAEFAVNGYVYAIERYDVSTDVPQYCGTEFTSDPWLES